MSPPQRVPGAESGACSGAANGPQRAGGTGMGPSIFDALPALWGSRCVGTGMSGRESGKQGGTAEIVFSVLAPLRGARTFFVRRLFYDQVGFPMAGLSILTVDNSTRPKKGANWCLPR